MSVIIRLQNLPWTANARDIRNFFSGLSIPEGGVHIIGGEMGDAFIAFSTDEDARCAMLKDREKLMEIQVRLLLSSRAEMQKVIETARSGAAAPAPATAAAPVTVPVPMPVVAAQPTMLAGLSGFLAQAKATSNVGAVGGGGSAGLGALPSFLAYQQQAGITMPELPGLRTRSRSRSRSTSSDDSEREREREWERERGRKRRSERADSRERGGKVGTGAAGMISPWAQPPPSMAGLNMGLSLNVPAVMPSLQNYTTSNTTNNVTNNYNLSSSVPNAQLLAALQQVAAGSSPGQVPAQVQVQAKEPAHADAEPIAFASVNPYAQMYPQLFQQQQLLLQQQQSASKMSPSLTASPGGSAGGNGPAAIADTCYIRINGLCPTTSYSDLRKYFQGLYIPHNGIKIMQVNGNRTGVAYVEFSRVSSAQKAIQRNNTMFRDRMIQVVPVGDDEFERAEERTKNHDGGRRDHNGGAGSGDRDRSDRGGGPVVTTVLYVEDLPQVTTEHEIMKMFSANYTVVDILLSPSPNNRRESVAFVLFARESEAQLALEDTSKHYIGFRQLRVRPSSESEMQNAKDKQRRANEQLLKEEEDEREQLLQEHQRIQQQEQEQQQQDNALANRFNINDPRRRLLEEQQQQMNMNLNMIPNQNINPNFVQAFANGIMPFNMSPMQPNGGNNFPFAMNNMNNNRNPNGNGSMDDGLSNGAGPQKPRQEDVFVRVHNCEYGTRVNDLGELFSLDQLRIEHIEQLFNERNQSTGEFIVEFVEPESAKRAIREFHNRRFRGRGLRIVPISPQEIADKMNKPFMDYLPGGGGRRQGDNQVAPVQQVSRRRGPSRFDDASNRAANSPQQQPQSLPLAKQLSPERQENSNGSSSGGSKPRFNPFARPSDPSLNSSSLSPNQRASPVISLPDGEASAVLPDKFSRPGCVVAMRNVPIKSELKDIMRFFGDYNLSPDDIIRRFSDDGKPTGDTRVAFETPAEARSAFESRRRKQIFNRNIHLEII
ncbi:hypothetical protein KR018_006003 [Drosophila ironensis]|nr:hypothetical protein KR018_006003 [Drosophila ironensis]